MGGSSPGSMALGLAAAGAIALAFASVSESNTGLSYGWDEGVYLASARWVARGAPLFERVFSSQPPVFVETLGLAFRLFGESGPVAARVSITFAALTLLSVAWMASRFLPPFAAPLAGLALLSKLFFDQAITVQAEMPALGLALLAMALLCPPLGGRPWAAAASGALFALAGLCKLWIVPSLLPAAVLLVLDPAVTGDGGWRVNIAWRRAGYRLLLFAGAGVLAGAALLSRYDLPSLFDQVVRFHWAARGLSADREGLGVLERFLQREAFVVLVAILGLAWLAFRNTAAALWLGIWLVAAALFLAWHEPLFARHALLLAPPLALLAVAPLQALEGRRRIRALAVPALGVLLLARPTLGDRGLEWTAPLRTQLPVVYVEDPDADEVIRLLRERTGPGDLVVTDSPIQAFLAGRDVPPQLVDVSGTRILSGDLTTEKAVAGSRGARAVVLWADRLARLPGYRRWVRLHFERLRKWRPVGTRRELYLARDPASIPGTDALPEDKGDEEP